MLRTFIHGSCVSRDLLADAAGDAFTLTYYSPRQSLIGLLNALPDLEQQVDLSRLTSRFQRRALAGTIRGDVAVQLARYATSTDLVLWDLTDERLGVYEWQGGYVARTIELINSGLDSTLARAATRVPFGSDEHIRLWRLGLAQWAAELRRHGIDRRTVLLAPPWAEHFSSGAPTPPSYGTTASAHHALAAPYYDMAMEELPALRIVGRHLDTYADENHRWGPAPFHYDAETSRRLAAELTSVAADVLEARTAQSSPQAAMTIRASEAPRTASPVQSAEPAANAEGNIQGLRYVRALDARVLPTAVSSQNGSVRGGYLPAFRAPSYVFQLRQSGARTVHISRFRHGDPTGYLRPGESADRVAGPAIYLGPLHRHFGHFATESITRVWYPLTQSAKSVRLVVMPEVDSIDERESYTRASMPEWQRGVFDYFGLTNLHFVRRETTFEDLVIPEQAAILNSRTHSPTYLDLLTEHRERTFGTSTPQAKVYYLRPSDPRSGRVAGEPYLARFLHSCGYQVVAPEKMPIRDQLALASSAAKVIATQGSALHIFNLLGRTAARVHVLQRTLGNEIASFADTIGPYVRAISIHTPVTALPGDHPETGLAIVDAAQLVAELHAFDSDIDPDRFDFAAFNAATLADVRMFLLAG